MFSLKSALDIDLKDCPFWRAEAGSIWRINPVHWKNTVYYGIHYTNLFDFEYSFSSVRAWYNLEKDDVIFKTGEKRADPYYVDTNLGLPDYFHKVLVTGDEGEIIEGWLHDYAIGSLTRMDKDDGNT